MAKIANLEFVALDIKGTNYLSWKLDAEMYLNEKGLEDTIKEENNASKQHRAKVIIFLRHHIHDDLKNEYLTVKDPLVLWNNISERYDHLKLVVLPKAQYNWTNLRFQDYKSVSDYNSAMFKITSELLLCGKNITDFDMMERTLSTFQASNVLL